jgi:hypothetical protein
MDAERMKEKVYEELYFFTSLYKYMLILSDWLGKSQERI